MAVLVGERETPPSLEDLDARLAKARGRRKPAGKPAKGGRMRLTGIGLAFRIGVELVAAFVVGAGIGLLLDRWLGTGPWLLVLFLFLGMGAGVLNVYRAVSGLGLAAGYRKREEEAEAEAEEEETD